MEESVRRSPNPPVRDGLSRFILEEILNGNAGNPLPADEDLLMSGLVDSIGMMRLVAHIESAYGIAVPPEDVTIESFRSVETISAYVERMREGG